ncbi:hypothetical protein PINS_up000606 [Pythium insidiosum]|nr:hypothetical protein PINS_up000606 [Pythium insidiosum]
MREPASAVATGDDGSAGPSGGCSALAAARPKRLQDELDAADEKLRQVAQHFSVEWKAFLAYAMKLKQETPEFASFPDKQRLEDLLLRSQSGLVMLREMQQRRDEKWQQLLPWWRAATEDAAQPTVDTKTRPMPVHHVSPCRRRHDARPLPTAPGESVESVVVVHRRAFLSRFTSFLDALVFMCQRFLTRRRLVPDTVPSGVAGERVKDPAMVQRMAKKLQWALNVRERLRLAAEQSNNNNNKNNGGGDDASKTALDVLQDDDVLVFARFQYLSQQHDSIFERFFIRLRWLPTAYRYHVRHRMLELAHQQTARSTPLSPLAQLEKAKVTDSVGGTVQCPLFPIRRHPIERDTTRMLASLRVTVARDSNWVATQLTVRSLLLSLVEQTRLPDAAASKLPTSKDDAISLLPGKVVRTRWDLSQMTTLEETDVIDEKQGEQRRETTTTQELHGTRTDLLLRNEFELLNVDDAEYVRVRLQSFVKCHFERAIVETTASDAATEQRSTRAYGSCSTIAANNDVEKARLLLERRTAIGATEELPPELLDVWYTTRYLMCRQLRLRLLRSLNYQHFLWTMRRMQASEVRRMSALGAKGNSAASAATRKKAEAHEGCMLGKWRVEELASGESVVLFDDTEHIFSAARRDLALLEAHLLDVASVFIEKQQRGVFDAMASHSGGSASGDTYPFSFVLAVDRMQVLTDLLDVELRFQQIKVVVATQMLVSGHEYLAANGIDTGGDLIGRLLQRRPRIDFDHAYFYDSYVAETVQLELQRELFRAMSAVSAQISTSSAVRDAEELWLHQQIIADSLATTYMRDVHAVLRTAEQQWFVTTSVTELHALQQAIHERMLVIWKSLLAIELPPGEQHSLPHTATSFFRGDGWRAGVKTDVLIDVITGDNNSDKSSTDVLRLVDALELLVWRHELGLEVYEASLLEKIWGVQQGFVDLLRSSRIDDPSLLFHDSVEGSKDLLVTITDVLSSEADALVDPTASKKGNDLKNSSRPQQRQTHKLRKNVADWLRTRVQQDTALLNAYWARCVSVLWMQQHYRWSLSDLVRYNDLVGAEIVEFAATSPFYFLSAFETPSPANTSEGTSSGGSGGDHALSLKAVHWKYMDEIVERIEDAAKRTCTPFWMPLMELQHMLCMRLRRRQGPPQQMDDQSFTESENVDDDEELLPLPTPTELEPCVGYLLEISTIPRLLVALSGIFEQLRHEQRFMRDLFPIDWHERCVFVSSNDDDERSRSEGDALSAWLHRKLEQLKLDVKATATADNSAIAQANRPLDLGIPFAPVPLLVGVSPDSEDAHASADEPKLLLRIPSTSSLLALFSVKQSTDSAATVREETEAALLALIEIYESFQRSLEVLRAETALGFFLKYEPHANTQSRRLGFRGTSVRRLPRFASSRRGLHAKTSTCSRTSPLSSVPSASSSSSTYWFFGKELLGAWQQALHRSIRALHDRLVERIGASAATRDLFVPTDWDSLRRRHQTMLFRREVAVALRDVNAEWKARLRCAVMALALQALSYRGSSAVEQREPEIAHLHRLEGALMMVDKWSHGDAVDDVLTRLRSSNAGSFPVLLRLRSHENSVDGADFYRAISDVHDVSYLRRLGDWLDLVFALVRDHMKMKRAINAEATDDGDVEAAILELERAVERYRVFYRLPADAEPLVPDASYGSVVASSSSSPTDKQQQSSSSQAGSVSGTRLSMKTPAIIALLSTSAVAAPVSVLARALRAITRSSLRQDDAVLSQNHNNNSSSSVVLPTLARLEFQIEMFRVHLQIQWIEDDVQHMQRHYESFLEQRRLFHAHVKQARKTTAMTRSAAAAVVAASSSPSSPRSSPSSTSGAETRRDVTRWLLHLSRYYRAPVINTGDENNGKETQDSVARYVIPADDMVELLNTVNQHLDQHYAQMLLALEQAGDEHERESRRLRSLAEERQRLVDALQRDEQLKRETYAVDRRYELVCQLEKQRHELSLLVSRKDTERELLRRELTVAFEKRLHEMHVMLLAKQHKFEEYRHTMQQDLKQQLQAAHAQLVHQLVDQSGSMSVETKTNFLASLDGHVATQAALHQENIALKHTLLKLQTLHEMHEQTRQLHAEKERATAEAFRLREQQLVGENAQLAHQIKQLEAELARTAQDRTYHQIKLNALERQMEAAAERRRQAKVRALSAPFRRHAHTLVTPEIDDDNPAAVESKSPSSPVKIVPRLPDFEADQEAFERSHEVAIRARSNTNAKEETMDASRVEMQCQNTIRHYQNEIRRLQQQLARESRLKVTLMERVSAQSSVEQTMTAGLQLDESAVTAASAAASASPVVAAAGATPLHTRRRLLLASPASPMASPRLRASSASTATPRRPMTGNTNAPRRPSTSIGSSPGTSSSSNHSRSRGSSESVDSTNSPWTPRQVPPLSLPSPGVGGSNNGNQTKPPRSAQSATPHRRFEVVKRDETVLSGGVAGVANPFSPREPLPYR